MDDWDYTYEIACNIIQAFDNKWRSPSVRDVIFSLKQGMIYANSNNLNDVIEWAKDYATEWYEKHMK